MSIDRPSLTFLGGVGTVTGSTFLVSVGIVLPDSGHLQEEEAAYANRVGYSKHHPALPRHGERVRLDLP